MEGRGEERAKPSIGGKIGAGGEIWGKKGRGGSNYTSGRGKCTVHIEKADCILDRTIR